MPDFAKAVKHLINVEAKGIYNVVNKGGLRYPELLDVYKKSRGQGFGKEVKRRIMLGTYALSAGYRDAYYLQAQKVRTKIKEDFEK